MIPSAANRHGWRRPFNLPPDHWTEWMPRALPDSRFTKAVSMKSTLLLASPTSTEKELTPARHLLLHRHHHPGARLSYGRTDEPIAGRPRKTQLATDPDAARPRCNQVLEVERSMKLDDAAARAASDMAFKKPSMHELPSRNLTARQSGRSEIKNFRNAL